MSGYASESLRFDYVEASASAGTTDLTTDILDMQGYDGVLFVVLTGDVSDTSALRLRPWQNTASSTSSPTPVELACTASHTASATDADSKLLAVDVLRPSARYVYAVLERDTANAVINGILAIRYRARSEAVTTTGILALAQALTPASV